MSSTASAEFPDFLQDFAMMPWVLHPSLSPGDVRLLVVCQGCDVNEKMTHSSLDKSLD